jgi:putative spermidine/putrescine transport system permease protein
MGGFRVGVLPIHIFQQVMQMAQFQFGAAVGVVLFLISLTSIAVYLRVGSSARGA